VHVPYVHVQEADRAGIQPNTVVQPITHRVITTVSETMTVRESAAETDAAATIADDAR
jgi:hypothetical protein